MNDVFISIVVVVRVTQLGLTFSMKAMLPSNMGQEDVRTRILALKKTLCRAARKDSELHRGIYIVKHAILDDWGDLQRSDKDSDSVTAAIKWGASGSVLVLVQNPLVPDFLSLDLYLPPCDLLLYLQCELLEEEALSVLIA